MCRVDADERDIFRSRDASLSTPECAGEWPMRPIPFDQSFLEIENTHKRLMSGGAVNMTCIFCSAAFSKLSSSCLFVTNAFLSFSQSLLFPITIPSGFRNFWYLPRPCKFATLSTQLLLSPIKSAIQSLLRLVLAYIPTCPFMYSSFSQTWLSFNSRSIFHIPEFGVFACAFSSLKYSFTPYTTYPSRDS